MNLKVIVAILLLLQSAIVMADDYDYDWVVGKWALVYDPDGGKTDYLEFLANGDVISSGPAGSYEGFYIASFGMIKAVLNIHDKDLILTFHHNQANTELRIITSDSGRASIYEKLELK